MTEPIVNRFIVPDALQRDARKFADATLPLVSLYGRREPRLTAEYVDRIIVLFSLILDRDTVFRQKDVQVLGRKPAWSRVTLDQGVGQQQLERKIRS
ncbi:MAG: hypothetical protein EOP89_13095, partial [Lysobacteraceae bacterium]